MNKKFLVSATAAALVASAVVPAANAAGFKDVTADNGHKKAIETLAGLNIVSGYEDGTFKPNLQLKRSHVVKMLGKWLVNQGNTIPANYKTVQRFKDVPVNHKDEELVKYAALVNDMGVFTGNQNKLNGQDSMRRDQMALVLTRAIKTVYKQDIVKQAQDAKFASKITDLKGLTADKVAAIQALEYKKITNVTQYKPLNTMTRAQFATFLYNTLNAQNTTPPKPQPKPDDIKTVEVVDQRTLKVTLNNGSVNDIHLLSDLPANKEVTIPIVVQGKDYKVTVTYVPKTQAFQVASIKQTSITEVEVTFSKPLNNKVLDNKTIQVRDTEGYAKEELENIILTNDNKTLKIITKNPLKEGVKYEVYAKQVNSQSNEVIGEVASKFVGIKDDNRPRIKNWENIGSNRFKIHFTKPVNSVQGANYRLTDGNIVKDVKNEGLDKSGNFMIFDFSNAKVGNKTIKLGSDVIIQLTGAIDKAGNEMAQADTNVQIKTRQPDGVKPTLAKAEQIIPKTIKLTFSEPILRASSDIVEVISDGKVVKFDYKADENDPKVYYLTLDKAVGGEVIVRTIANKNVVDYSGEVGTFSQKLTMKYNAEAPQIGDVKVAKVDGKEYLVFKIIGAIKGVEQGTAEFTGEVRVDGKLQKVTSSAALLQHTNNEGEYMVSLGALFAKADPQNVTYQGELAIDGITNDYDIAIENKLVTFDRSKDEVTSNYQIKLSSDLQAIETHKNSRSTVLDDSYIRVNFDAPVDIATIVPANFELAKGEIESVMVDEKNNRPRSVLIKLANVKAGTDKLTISGVRAQGSTVVMDKVTKEVELNAYSNNKPKPEASTVTAKATLATSKKVDITFSEALTSIDDATFELFVGNEKHITTASLNEDKDVVALTITSATTDLTQVASPITFSINQLKDKDGKVITVTKQQVTKQ